MLVVGAVVVVNLDILVLGLVLVVVVELVLLVAAPRKN
jgi:hypothetical protein